VASSVPPPVPLVFGTLCRDEAADPPPLARSFELSKLWKKFWRTSCCVCPDVGLGLPAEDNVGDVPARPAPWFPTDTVAPRAASVDDGGRPVARLLASALPVGPTPTSISERARSTAGRLKLLLPSGPTIPAAAVPAISDGFLNAPRGSRSGFLAFSS
jgi:hypothetical protein